MRESLRTYKKALQIQKQHNKNNDTKPNAYNENKKIKNIFITIK